MQTKGVNQQSMYTAKVDQISFREITKSKVNNHVCRCVLLLVCQCVCSLSPPSSGMLWEGVRTEDELCKLCKNIISNSEIQITYCIIQEQRAVCIMHWSALDCWLLYIQLMTTHTVVILTKCIDEHSSSKSRRT